MFLMVCRLFMRVLRRGISSRRVAVRLGRCTVGRLEVGVVVTVRDHAVTLGRLLVK
jgi:hypothetical protein